MSVKNYDQKKRNVEEVIKLNIPIYQNGDDDDWCDDTTLWDD